MRLTQDSESLATGKILILYLLNKVNRPITNLSILKLTSNIKEINYFYIQQFLSDLIESKYIITYPKEDFWVYELSPEGKKVLSLTETLLPGIVKLKIDTCVDDNLENIQNERAVTSECFPESENTFTVKCKLTEGYTTLFELSVFAGSKEQAKKISQNWKANSDKLYPQIIDLLTEQS